MTDTIFTRAGGAGAESDAVRRGGLRSDGELVQGVSDRFLFSAAEPAAADPDHKDWIDLLSMGGGAAGGQEPPTIALEPVDRIHDDPPAAPDDLL